MSDATDILFGLVVQTGLPVEQFTLDTIQKGCRPQEYSMLDHILPLPTILLQQPKFAHG